MYMTLKKKHHLQFNLTLSVRMFYFKLALQTLKYNICGKETVNTQHLPQLYL